MRKKQLTAVATERLFGVIILLLLVGLVADFIFVTNFLKNEAVKAQTLRAQSEATDSDVAKLKSAKAWLDDNKEIVKRTSAIVAQSKLYQYQNQIIEDFNGYGGQTGISISGYSFTVAASASTPAAPGATATSPPVSSAAPSPGTGSTTAPSPGSATGTGPKAPVGVNSVTVTVTFGDKVNYQSFLNFLRLLEQNVTRMQVTDLSLNPDAKEPQNVTNPTITVIVYTR